MKNVLRTLVYEDEVSLTLIDSTEIVREAIRLHSLTRPSAIALGKALTVMVYAGACLKDPDRSISVSVRGNGEGGEISVSGNGRLQMRGYIGNPVVPALPGESDEDAERRCLGSEGTLTVIRDDGYGRPFVGSCLLPDSGLIDRAFEAYYRVSEQLPAKIASVVRMEGENCAFAGAAVLQPLPFASEKVLNSLPTEAELGEIAEQISALGPGKCAQTYFSAKSAVLEEREAAYKCNCSREYLSGVLVSLGKEELEDILRKDGEIRVHCHYCNTDYRFTREDVDKLFP